MDPREFVCERLDSVQLVSFQAVLVGVPLASRFPVGCSATSTRNLP